MEVLGYVIAVIVAAALVAGVLNTGGEDLAPHSGGYES